MAPRSSHGAFQPRPFPKALLRRSAGCGLSPSLFACLQDLAHIPSWTNLEDAAVLHRRVLRHKLERLVHVARLEDQNAAELFLGFGVGTVGGGDFAVLPI